MEYVKAWLVGGAICAVGQAVREEGWLGVLTGGMKAAAGGISAAVVFGFLAALLFQPKDKS